MLSLLAASLVLSTQDAYIQRELNSPFSEREGKLFIRLPEQRLPTSKLSPKVFGEDKIRYEFDWLTPAYMWITPEQAPCRFRVYSQEHQEEGDLAAKVAQTLLRLYDYNYEQLRLTHNDSVNYGIVDVYLCWGGVPGGEQLTDQEIINNRPVKVNTIYIYDLGSFTKPIEQLREIAHEYGHAALPAVGGFQKPEDWGNGFLGERLYLMHLRDGMQKKWYDTRDTMGASFTDLDAWVKANVEPGIMKAASAPPDPKLLGSTGQAAMDSYLGLTTYMASILPGQVFLRSMKVAGSQKAGDYPDGISLALQERPSIRLNIPPYLQGKTIWVPIADGSLSGTAVLVRKEGWVQVKPGTGPLTVVAKKR